MSGEEKKSVPRDTNDTRDSGVSNNRKLIINEGDTERGIVNIYYIETQKKYNADPIDEGTDQNAVCRCSIF